MPLPSVSLGVLDGVAVVDDIVEPHAVKTNPRITSQTKVNSRIFMLISPYYKYDRFFPEKRTLKTLCWITARRELCLNVK
jgi:hypothetical protein